MPDDLQPARATPRTGNGECRRVNARDGHPDYATRIQRAGGNGCAVAAGEVSSRSEMQTAPDPEGTPVAAPMRFRAATVRERFAQLLQGKLELEAGRNRHLARIACRSEASQLVVRLLQHAVLPARQIVLNRVVDAAELRVVPDVVRLQ